MDKNEKIITDIVTLQKLLSTKTQGYWHKLILPVLAANIISLISGVGVGIKNYYVFLDTVKAVERIEKAQQIQQEEIENLRIIQGIHGAKINDLEKHGR